MDNAPNHAFSDFLFDTFCHGFRNPKSILIFLKTPVMSAFP
jgi:hypothetical protein